jgi:hypothetical protein
MKWWRVKGGRRRDDFTDDPDAEHGRNLFVDARRLEWWHPSYENLLGRRLRVIPHRCWSVHVTSAALVILQDRGRGSPSASARGMCGRRPAPATAEKDRFDRRRKRRECLEDSSAQTSYRPLDSHRFIDAQRPGNFRNPTCETWPLPAAFSERHLRRPVKKSKRCLCAEGGNRSRPQRSKAGRGSP